MISGSGKRLRGTFFEVNVTIISLPENVAIVVEIIVFDQVRGPDSQNSSYAAVNSSSQTNCSLS